MNSQIPFFSVVIPTYNRRDLLKKAVNSVLSQTLNNLELIVIDDGSNDGTKDLMSRYRDERIIYDHQENKGVSSARNTGLERAKGPFIAFLDSDDHWVPQKLERHAEYIKELPEVKIFHTEEIWYRHNKFLDQKKKHRKPSGFVYDNALPLCCISISTAVINKAVFDDIGVFDETFEACEDYDFWLRATNKYEVKLIPEALTIKDGGRPDQLSSKIWGLDRFRIRALEKMLTDRNLDEKNYRSTLEEFDKKCRIFAQGARKHGKTKDAGYYSGLPGKYTIK